MKNSNSLDNIDGQSYMVVSDESIIEVSQSFVEMTEYSADELLNKNITDIFRTLRVGPNFDIKNIDEQAGYFLFNKRLEVRHINIEVVKEKNERIYTLKIKPDLMLEQKFDYLLQMSYENITAILIYSVPDLIILRANQTALDNLEDLYNVRESALGKSLYDIDPGWKGTNTDDAWKNIMADGRPKSYKESQYDSFRKGMTYWDTTFTPIKEDGNVKYLVVNSKNVTESVLNRKKIQEQMEVINLKNKQMEAIFENMSDEIMVFDKNGNFIFRNKAALKFEELNSITNFYDLYKHYIYFDLEGNELLYTSLPHIRIINGEKIKELIMCVKIPGGEKYIAVSGTPLFDDNGNFRMGISCVRDITELIGTELQIRSQKERLEAIIKSMSDGLELVDNKLKITFLNKSAKDFFYNPDAKVNAGDSLQFNKYYYGIDGEEIPREDLPAFRILNKGSFKNYILTISRPDKKIYASINGSPIYNNEGIVNEAIFCIRDITEQIMKENEIKYHQEIVLQAEREKREALEQTIEMKDEFLSLISHEFRTPLTVINTAIQAMEYICFHEFSDETKKFIGTIRRNTFRQLRLVNNLLDITRANAGHIKIQKRNMDIVFLTKAIVDSVYSYASQKGVRLIFVSTFEKKVIGIDEEKYERILLNLLSNAIKFTPEGKSIVINLRSMKSSVCVEVKDTGIGIPEDKVDLIFEKFGQVDSSLSRRAEGAGIGLSLVKKFVEALGGSISVKSKLGKGSTFTILLPKDKVTEDNIEEHGIGLMDNRLVQVTNVEFSDIYL